MTSLTPTVQLVHGIPVVSSLKVAEHFGKPHADVLKSVRKIALECAPEFSEGNFSLAEFLDEQGKPRPMYQLSRDGFTLVAMGFTGKQALAWKIRYIEAFNTMADSLRKKAAPKPRQAALPLPPARDPLDLSHYFKAMRSHSRRLMEEYSDMVVALKVAYPMNWNRQFDHHSTDYAALPLLDMVGNFASVLDGTLRAVQNHAEAFARVKRL